MPNPSRSLVAFLSRKRLFTLIIEVMLMALLISDLYTRRAFFEATSNKGGLQYGDVSGWMQSFGSLAAVVVALWQTRKLELREIESDIRRRQESNSQVYAWILYERDAGVGGWHIFFSNMTPAPVGPWVLRILNAETDAEVHEVNGALYYPIAPGSSRRPLGDVLGDAISFKSALEFVDTEGRCWRRDSNGRLKRLDKILIAGSIVAQDVDR